MYSSTAMSREESSKTTERLGSVIALLSLGFVVVAFARNWREIPPLNWSWTLVLAVALGVLANGLSMMLMSHVWLTLLRRADVELSASRSFVICGKTQLLKYLPGNVFHVVGRTGLAVREGIPIRVAISSITLEILLTAGTAALIAMPLLSSRWRDISRLIDAGAWWNWLFAAVVGAAVVVVAGRFAGARVRRAVAGLSRMADPATLLKAVPCIALTFVVTGGALYFFVVSAWPGRIGISALTCIIGFALAWVIGFATPGAPGGIGIRELVFLALFAGPIGYGMAAALAIASRLLSVVGDVSTFSAALAVEKLNSR